MSAQLEIVDLQRLAGIGPYQPVSELNMLAGSNISVTGNEKAQIMRDKNIQPGTEAWFKLWFARPLWIKK